MPQIHLDHLFTKYNQAGPRYTSYPPIPYWKEVPIESEWLGSLDSPVSIYIHIPFCRTLCFYCGCHTITTGQTDLGDAYVTNLLREWQIYQEYLGESKLKIEQLHLGGGTPTYLSEKQLEQLLVPLARSFNRSSPKFEFSIEADPRTTTSEKLRLLQSLGANRLSLGVQDFDPNVQRLVNRVQPFELVYSIVDLARASGFRSINFDLVYGLPGQTKKTIVETARKTLRLAPERIAWYGYAHVPWLKPAQRRWDESSLPQGLEKLRLYETGRQELLAGEYQEVGMDHFAKPDDDLFLALEAGTLSRNFMGYIPKRVMPLIGLGVSAIGESADYFVQSQKELSEYSESMDQRQLPILRGHRLTAEDKLHRSAIVTLMSLKKVDLDGFSNDIQASFSDLVDDGLVVRDGSKIYVTQLGLPFLRTIASRLDRYLDGKKEGRFSKVI